jgi:hypothetical protein
MLKDFIVIEENGEVVVAPDYNSIAGRLKLAQSMLNPLRTVLDYQSIGRKTFLVDNIE